MAPIEMAFVVAWPVLVLKKRGIRPCRVKQACVHMFFEGAFALRRAGIGPFGSLHLWVMVCGNPHSQKP